MPQKKSRKFIWLLVPAIFFLFVLAAHFSRQNINALALVTLMLPFLLFYRKKWILWFIQIVLVTGSVEWLRSTLALIRIRTQMNEDWTRLAIILFSVTLLTLISGLLLFSKKVRKEYT